MAAELRLALWHVPLTRDGPGLLVRDLLRGEPALVEVASALREADADILVLTDVDYDADGLALARLAELIAVEGEGYAHRLALRANAGIPTGIDLDGNGRLGDARDAQAFGRFPGEGASALLSRLPIAAEEVRSFNDLMWRDIPKTLMAPADAGRDVQRLSSGGHWLVPIEADQGRRLTLMIGHSTTPVFDGPEDRNGRRNHDELALWSRILDGEYGPAPPAPRVFMVNTNLDPKAGEGYRGAMAAFLGDTRWQDPLPDQPTAFWERTGPLRVSYLLPSADVTVRDARTWPALGSHVHRLVTLDITLP